MARGRGGKGLALVILAAVGGVGTSVLLLVTLTSQDPGTPPTQPEKAPANADARVAAQPPAPPG